MNREKPELSVIIPTYNAAETLQKLLHSLETSTFAGHEVIVVDDGSTDGTLDLLRPSRVRVFRTPSNSGPAVARNLGVRQAKGDVVLFLDSDVVVERETLEEVRRFFRDHPERSVMIGVYSPDPANRGAWPLYKALQCFSYYWRFPVLRDVTLLWSAVAAFRRDVFLRSGGFSARFGRPSMEDLELGRRIAATDPIVLNRRVVVRHHFPSTLRRNVKDHFHRGYLWVKIYFRHHQFDNYLSTPRRALGRLAAFAMLPALAAGLFRHEGLFAAAAYFLVYLACNWDLWAVVARRSPSFLPVALAIDLLLGWVLGAAAVSAVIDESVRLVGRLFRRSPRALSPAALAEKDKT